jgi:acetylornithine deacetylase/succinyl-diaminopimelate desuccinylase-like protein
VTDFAATDRFLEDRLDPSLAELSRLVAQPSVAAQGLGMEACARLVAGMFEARGFAAEILPTGGPPVVVAERAGASERTLLVYNHYDVQPPEPLELWHSPPFEPVIRDGRIYGRGTSDNKAQLFTYLKTVETMQATFGALPISLKFLYEGEEEIGSPNLKPFCEQNRDRLAASLTYYSDSHIHESGRPILILGLKGMVYVELKARGTREDQHSMRATSLPNAAWRLVWALSTLKDTNSRIAIRGFYDDVRPLTNLERTAVANIPVDEAKLKEFFGIGAFLKGRESSDYYFNLVSEPTCNIAGLISGYTGPGSKTVLPAEATAKIDMRLVPDQKPDDIARKLRRHLDAQGFADIEISPSQHFLIPSRTPIDHPAVDIIAAALRETYEAEPIIFPNIGGAGPNYIFTDVLKQPCFVVPHATHDQANHAPNENMEVEGFFRGIRTQCRVFEKFAALR